jgi:hypothetical protein
MVCREEREKGRGRGKGEREAGFYETGSRWVSWDWV